MVADLARQFGTRAWPRSSIPISSVTAPWGPNIAATEALARAGQHSGHRLGRGQLDGDLTALRDTGVIAGRSGRRFTMARAGSGRR